MSYEIQKWNKYDELKTEEENIENGAVVTDNRMNHIEKGISDVEKNSNQAVQITNAELSEHKNDVNNPHGVTASQTGAYTKSEVDNNISDVNSLISSHASRIDNPHNVTKNQVGLGAVDNVQQAPKATVDSHISNKSNPHATTASQVGAFTKSEVSDLISNAIKQAKLEMNPVGTVLSTINSTSPSEYLGGTWERFGRGRTLVGVDEADSVILMNTANNNGGSANPLTSHSHVIKRAGGSTTTGGVGADINWANTTDNSAIQSTGDNTNHNNWQPFVTVYFWKRTA